MLGERSVVAILPLTTVVRHPDKTNGPSGRGGNRTRHSLRAEICLHASWLPYAPGDFFCRPAHCCAEATGKKSQTRPVLRPGRTSGRNLSSVFSGAVRGTRPLFSETVAYQRLLSRSLLSRPCSAARALLPMLPAVFAILAFICLCSAEAVPFCTACAARVYASFERSSKKPMRLFTSFPPKCRQDCRRTPYKNAPVPERFGCAHREQHQDSLSWNICIVPCSAGLVKFIAIIRAN